MPDYLLDDITETKVADEEWHYRFTCPKCKTKNSWRKYGSRFKKTHCISCRTEFTLGRREDYQWAPSDSSN